MRNPPCGWLGYDHDGRPHCVHGKAFNQGTGWICREAARLKRIRYRDSEKGREARRRENADPHARSRKALYDLTRIRTHRSNIAP